MDDAVALSMGMKMAHKYNYEIKMISAVFGNCSLDRVVKNVAKTRAACGLDATTGPPLYMGESIPLVAERMDAGYFHGEDGLGNNSFDDEPTGIKDGEHAVDALLATCAEGFERKIPVTLLTLGPLTNLAKAIQKDNSILTHIDRLVVIGGCGNARGNVGRTTEFNVCADPEAMNYVLSALLDAGILCTIVSWELTLAYSIPWSLYDEMMSTSSSQRSRLNNFLREICQFSFKSPHLRHPVPHYSHPDEYFGGADICDALAMAIALNPEEIIVLSEKVNVEVELEGKITRGQTVVDWGCFDAVVRKKNCDWILKIHHDVYLRMFRELFD